MLSIWPQPKSWRQTSCLLQLDTLLSGQAEQGATQSGFSLRWTRCLLYFDFELFLSPLNLFGKRVFLSLEVWNWQFNCCIYKLWIRLHTSQFSFLYVRFGRGALMTVTVPCFGLYTAKWIILCSISNGQTCFCQVMNFHTDCLKIKHPLTITFSVQYFCPPSFSVFLFLSGSRCRCEMNVSQWCVVRLVANLMHILVNQNFLLSNVQIHIHRLCIMFSFLWPCFSCNEGANEITCPSANRIIAV